MFGPLIAILLIFIVGIGGLLFSILSWRLKNQTLFYLAIGCIGIQVIYFIVNFEYMYYLLQHSETAIWGIAYLTFIFLPVFFLVQAKTKPNSGNTDTDVTDAFLDEIINADDEEIDYES